jgi:hypothetical protein
VHVNKDVGVFKACELRLLIHCRYLYRLVEIAEYPGLAARLGGLLHKLPTKFAFYKRKPVWGEVVLEHLDEMAKRHPVEVKSDDEMGHTLDDRKSPTEAR